MIFVHEPVNIQEAERVEIDGKRFYQSPNTLEYYPSITTALKGFKKDMIDKWIARIGEDAAEKIRNKASYRGDSIHALCESYLENRLDLTGVAGHFKTIFNEAKIVLDKHVGTIYGIEKRLFSDKLKLAGTADLISMWDGELAVIDFKTSRWMKSAKDIDNYFMQAAGYAAMYYERTGLTPKKIVIILCSEYEGPVVYVRQPGVYLDMLVKYMKNMQTETAFG